MISKLCVGLCGLVLAAGTAGAQPEKTAGPPQGSGSYDSFVDLFQAFEDWRTTRPFAVTPDGVEILDYSDAVVTVRLERLEAFQAHLAEMNAAAWDRSGQAEYLAVRARMDEHEFWLTVSRPFERDPGFYVDPLLRIAFAELPAEGEARERLIARLRAVPALLDTARANLDSVAADYADLALFNLTNPDGVGHGHPYRAEPPAGVIGWYEDLLDRTEVQPELRAEVEAALSALRGFRAWLEDNRASMTAPAGVGEARFDWYLQHVKLMPYTAREIVEMGEREIDRLWAFYALERHRNRTLPELEPAASAQDYAARIAETDAAVRAFLEAENFITVPDHIGELDTNAPWIVRPGGRNFWEEVQYRDPSPDHIHAVIPGHRFDALMVPDHPVRGQITDGARAEGWATYLEEAMVQAGYFEERPRARELIYIFGIFRAARVPADVWLQTNQMTVSEVVDYWRDLTPYLDEDVARVDAEIYLRRPPGYGLGYQVGAMQMQALLGDRRRQLGEDFSLREFHDDFLSRGRLPISLIRWEMTGLDDEVKHFWDREPIPARE